MMQAIAETLFDIVYLVSVITIGVLMIRGCKGEHQFRLFGWMAVVLGDLYARGITIVSSEHGYGLYFRREDTLYFIELMADDDRAAEVLMEAARQKEVVVEKAVVTVGASQPLFYGEGTRQEYGMIRFLAAPFDLSESYMRLMLAE